MLYNAYESGRWIAWIFPWTEDTRTHAVDEAPLLDLNSETEYYGSNSSCGLAISFLLAVKMTHEFDSHSERQWIWLYQSQPNYTPTFAPAKKRLPRPCGNACGAHQRVTCSDGQHNGARRESQCAL